MWRKWAVNTEKDTSGFDEAYYRKIPDPEWSEVALYSKVIHGSSYNLRVSA
jgi:hypothetical protein